MSNRHRLFAGLLIGLSITISASAQTPSPFKKYDWIMPQASPAASVSQTVGVTDISISYHRPELKDRTLTTNYLPYGKVWRAGANEATTIIFGTDVSIEGKPLKAGTYNLYMIPGATEWTVIFNTQSKQWGAFTYDEKGDVLRVPVTPQTAEMRTRLEYSFPEVTDNSARVMMSWGTIRVPINVTVDTTKMAVKKAEGTFDWGDGYFAANYFFQDKKDLAQALRWINASIAVEQNTANLQLKGQILAEMGKYDDAIQTIDKIVLPATPASERSKANIQKLRDEWTAKAGKKS
jgi:hypothetical protein